MARAEAIRSGGLYGTDSVIRNTIDFVSFEQALVEQALRDLRARSKEDYRREVELADAALSSMAGGSGCVSLGSLRLLRTAILTARDRCGRLPSFESQLDREAIGVALAFVQEDPCPE